MQGSRWQGRSRRGQHLRSPLVYQPWLEPFNMSTRSTKLLIKRRQKKKKKKKKKNLVRKTWERTIDFQRRAHSVKHELD
jgi:hypothetical protein